MATATSTGSWLDPPELHGKRNSDGTFTLEELELKKLNDYNRKVSKMIQGGLNLANLNEATNETFTGMVKFVDLSDPTKSTVIDGSHITTGTISADRVSGGTLEGVTVISSSGIGSHGVELTNGGIYFVRSGGGYPSFMFFDGDDSKMKFETLDFVPLKISAGDNVSMDAKAGYGIYIGVSNNGETIEIGSSTATINLNGSVYHNGTPL